ncbi:hypothetical protein [Flavobacterium sp.]|uniref:hypothetical protein n=1 Tax=Flavobacterium sp. TaxID=239 RepID=UPI003750952E
MSSDSQNVNDNQEIDLSQISKKIGSFFENISTMIFKGILFIKKNIIVLGILFVLGAVLGFYIDKTSKSYMSEVIVTPNFGSNSYLYSKIDLLNSKISEGDTVFLKTNGFTNVKKIHKIEIKPILDIYEYIKGNAQSFELIKLMAEDGDLNKIIEDKLTSKNYPFHQLQIATSVKFENESLVKPLLKFLNTTDYYSKLKKEYVNNVNIKLSQNDSIIKQIDGFLDNFKKTTNNGLKSSNLIYYNDNMQLNDIIKTKDALISEQGALRLEIVNYENIIKDISVVNNIENNKGLNNKMKLILPFLFLFLFFAFSILKSFYKTQLAKSKL